MGFDRKLEQHHSKIAVKQTAAYRKELLERYNQRVELQDKAEYKFTDWQAAQELQTQCELLEKLLGLGNNEWL